MALDMIESPQAAFVRPRSGRLIPRGGDLSLTDPKLWKMAAPSIGLRRGDIRHNSQFTTQAIRPLPRNPNRVGYAVSKLDQTISPGVDRFLAARMKATTVELEAGHVSLVSHPQEIANLILAAAVQQK
jgi:hypothetical protein